VGGEVERADIKNARKSNICDKISSNLFIPRYLKSHIEITDETL
jgi:hypothetical protein